MDIITQNNGNFIISDYLDIIGKEKNKGKYKCPNCNEFKLSINKDGKQYYCYGCHDTKAIAYQIMKRAGILKTKSSSSNFSQSAKKRQINKIGKSKSGLLLTKLKQLFPDLRYNLLNKQIYHKNKLFSDEICSPELLYIWLLDNFDLEIKKERCLDYLLYLAQKKKFNPLLEYLESLKHRYYQNNQDKTLEEILNLAQLEVSRLSTKYLHTDQELYDVYLQNWLFSAVARAYRNGCNARQVLILKGSQNIGKSSFFSIIGKEFFSDSLMENRDKDALLLCHSKWILEWQELEAVWGQKSISRVKSFISSRKDNLRLPYAKTTTEVLRGFVLCGTTNEESFLFDKTGNTRFWIIPTEKISLRQWENNIETILGACAVLVDYYLQITESVIDQGELWELNDQKLIAENQSNALKFTAQHPFEEQIDELIDIWTQGTSETDFIYSDKIWEHLGLNNDQKTKHYMTIGRILNAKGFKSTTKKKDGQVKRIWRKI